MLEKPKAGFDDDARLQAEPNYKERPLLRVKNQAEPLLVVEMSAAVCLTG